MFVFRSFVYWLISVYLWIYCIFGPLLAWYLLWIFGVCLCTYVYSFICQYSVSLFIDLFPVVSLLYFLALFLHENECYKSYIVVCIFIYIYWFICQYPVSLFIDFFQFICEFIVFFGPLLAWDWMFWILHILFGYLHLLIYMSVFCFFVYGLVSIYFWVKCIFWASICMRLDYKSYKAFSLFTYIYWFICWYFNAFLSFFLHETSCYESHWSFFFFFFLFTEFIVDYGASICLRLNVINLT